MAKPDTAATPMTDADVIPASPAADGVAAEPTKGPTADLRQTVTGTATDLRDQAAEKARFFADAGKTRATEALGQVTQMLNDAAEQVDEKLGAQYGQYARNAAEQVQTLQTRIGDTSIDDLLDTTREFVRKSPGVAIGAAATIGFVAARLLTAGLEQRGGDAA